MVSDPVANKRKRSACSTVQLTQYLEAIKQLLDGIEDGDSDIPDLLAQVVDKIETQLAQAKVRIQTAFHPANSLNSQCISSSSSTEKINTTSKITERPGLFLKKSWEARVQDIMSIGSDDFMSVHTFYALLSMLSSLIPSTVRIVVYADAYITYYLPLPRFGNVKPSSSHSPDY